MKKYDLITSINSRGTFAITQACMPHMIANGYGRVITMSPPIVSNHRAFAGKTAYYISKFGMTMCALGAAAEGQGKGVTGNSLWPATIIESLASINFKLGDPSTWRKADILADCVVGICEDSDDFTGNSAPPLARALPRPCRPRFASVLRTCPPRLSSSRLRPSPALSARAVEQCSSTTSICVCAARPTPISSSTASIPTWSRQGCSRWRMGSGTSRRTSSVATSGRSTRTWRAASCDTATCVREGLCACTARDGLG